MMNYTVLNYQTMSRSNRPKGVMVKHLVQFLLFAAFSLWLLYQIRRSNGDSGPSVSNLSDDRTSNFMGRKGSGGLLKSTPITVTLEDVTNPLEEGEIRWYSKGIEEVEFHIKAESFMEVNDTNNLPRGQDVEKSMKKSNISFSDENGIPQDVHDKFIRVETSKSLNETRVKVQNLIVTRADNGNNRTIV